MKLSFEELYNQMKKNLEGNFQDLIENAKKESKRNTKISLIICIIIDIIIVLLFIVKGIGNDVALLIVAIWICLILDLFIFIMIHAIFSKNNRECNKRFKESIISTLIGNFYDNVMYNPTFRLDRRVYDEARYNEYYNRYEAEDYFKGQILNRYNMEMAEIKTEKVETRRDSNGNTRTTTDLKFFGLFAKVNMEKSLQTSLQIRGNNKISVGEQVRMDSLEFEKYFDIASDNKIITMQVLTHEVMEMLIDFQIKSGIKFDISIYGRKMYLRFHTREMFELKSIKKGVFDEDMLRKYYDVLEFTYVLSKRLIELIEAAKI